MNLVLFKYEILFAMVGWIFLTLRQCLIYRSKHFWALGFVASLWPVGKVLQYWHTGPILARSYLSDLGFVAAFGLLPLVMVYFRKTKFRSARRMAILGFVAAMAFELLFITIQPAYKGDFGARGDWVDVAIFVLTFGWVWYTLGGIERDQQVSVPTQPVAALTPSGNRSKQRKQRRNRRKKRARR